MLDICRQKNRHLEITLYALHIPGWDTEKIACEMLCSNEINEHIIQPFYPHHFADILPTVELVCSFGGKNRSPSARPNAHVTADRTEYAWQPLRGGLYWRISFAKLGTTQVVRGRWQKFLDLGRMQVALVGANSDSTNLS